MKSNFSFLEAKFPILSNLGSLAESYLYSDSNSCLIKLGMIGETIINLIFIYDHIPYPKDDNMSNRIFTLYQEGLLTKDLTDIFNALRKVRNKAAHENFSSEANAKILLEMTFDLCEWFMQTYGDWSYKSQKFILPSKNITYLNRTISNQEENEKALFKQTQSIAKSAAKVKYSERIKQANVAANKRKKSEAETRYLIDEQLRKVGWEADSINLRYSKGTRPQKGRNIAIAEWPTDSDLGIGHADYVLFVGLKMVGIIEAKAEYKDIPAIIDYQGKDYSCSIRECDAKYQINTWDNYKVPFAFATNGRAYLKQLETKSGIWFLDLRQSFNIPKALQGWISPEGIIELLDKDISKSNRVLEQTSYELLEDKDGLNLRKYQIKAIKAAEASIINGKKTVLLSMATGTGKTRTVLGMIYRFLKSGRFCRILFLVDRTSLGEQAYDVFKEVKLEDLMTLNQIYNIKGLDNKEIDKETRIHIATVQSMVKRIIYNTEDTIPSVTDYDLIIIDEAHRGYILDKALNEAEIYYRDQIDYISKYRKVIEYFEAVKIAITATPALHTTKIFGYPVFNYSYREAVVEGYLVDHDAPHIIETELSKNDIVYKKGEKLTLYNPITHEITNSCELEDEIHFDVDKFNRKVITESFNRTVLSEIAKDIDPESSGKTLIYAVNDNHADMIVQILKEIYCASGVDNNAIMKITGSIGDKKKISEAIKHFKNERFPSIVVTVDLLTTGIDVPEITTLVFLRRVKSRILYEQMLGRATRLCPKIQKTHFEIYDAVGIYESLKDISTMKPVVTNPNTTYKQLLDELEGIESNDSLKAKAQIDLILAKLQRQKQKLSSEIEKHFISLSGGVTVSGFINKLKSQTVEEAKKTLISNRKLFELIQNDTIKTDNTLIISDKEDKLISHTRGYGKASKPQDYLDSFEAYIKTNLNKIVALNIVCNRPKELTRESLKSLKLALDREGYTTKQLNTAISELTNEEIAADIISLIRRYAIGSDLINHEARIHMAVDKLKKTHSFNKQELNWINRIEKYLIEESVLNVDVFNEDGRFKSQGGFTKINKVFKNQLRDIVLELNDYLYQDGGHIA